MDIVLPKHTTKTILAPSVDRVLSNTSARVLTKDAVDINIGRL